MGRPRKVAQTNDTASLEARLFQAEDDIRTLAAYIADRDQLRAQGADAGIYALAKETGEDGLEEGAKR
jgi:hypothetical protein